MLIILAEEKEKLLGELKAKKEEFEKEQEAKAQLVNKLKAMESKLLTGGKNIIDHTNEQERKLQERR